MQRIKTGTNRNPATDKFGTGKHGFKTGNRSLGDPPSTPGAEWFDVVQEEIAQAIEQAGVALLPYSAGNPASYRQLFAAIKKIAWGDVNAPSSPYAPLASPEFTGTPKAPTLMPLNTSQQLVNAAYLEDALSGQTNVNIAAGGTVTLTDDQVNSPHIYVSGVPATPVTVEFPTSTKRVYWLSNTTTFDVTFKVAGSALAGMVLQAGKRKAVYITDLGVNDIYYNIAMSGTPIAPTAVDGVNTVQVATTAFVQSAIGGNLQKNVTGGTVTLTDGESSNTSLTFVGALTSALTVIVPASVRRNWIVFNSTSGAFGLTVKTAAGTGVGVAQGKRNQVYSDGTNVYDGFNDFESISLTGTPTAPTAVVGTNTTQLATTAFVTAAGGSFLPKTGVGLTGALRAVGGLVNANNTLNVGVVGAVDNDTGLSWVSDGVLATTSNGVIRERINADTSAESFFGTGNAYKLSLQTDGNVVLRNPSSTVMWDAFATVRKTDFTGSYTANSGWRKYPDASSPTGFMIEQWGKTAALGQDVTLAVTYPIPFPTAMCGSPFLVEVATATPRIDGAGVLSALNPDVNGFTLHKATDTTANAVAWRVWGY
ncbi:hypothetical protein DTO96_102536 [Ephemeroptericola cinctiostellae]|uniref:Putative tail fiber protein gp53-like C-terminal domain-containing protein n=1 Tax=Ephemeroptericola cinctiostellae TaxID=2268024 RepID=A0A345DEJ2_9BURK|nr:hypothetical protein [Ephemeroptericola cinctiostellae]AXF86780.1 hypothetical protein DTO96_102536 [Ephemeroptericola cinctiostellae]